MSNNTAIYKHQMCICFNAYLVLVNLLVFCFNAFSPEFVVLVNMGSMMRRRHYGVYDEAASCLRPQLAVYLKAFRSPESPAIKATGFGCGHRRLPI